MFKSCRRPALQSCGKVTLLFSSSMHLLLPIFPSSQVFPPTLLFATKVTSTTKYAHYRVLGLTCKVVLAHRPKPYATLSSRSSLTLQSFQVLFFSQYGEGLFHLITSSDLSVKWADYAYSKKSAQNIVLNMNSS